VDFTIANIPHILTVKRLDFLTMIMTVHNSIGLSSWRTKAITNSMIFPGLINQPAFAHEQKRILLASLDVGHIFVQIGNFNWAFSRVPFHLEQSI